MLSIVIPVYQCANCLATLQQRLTHSLQQLNQAYEIIYVDDRGPDDSWKVLQHLSKNDAHIKAIRLSKNFGQHVAITAGLSMTQGDWVIVMDCDLQDPPEEIAKLYAKAHEGYDIVFARRQEKKHSFLKRLASEFYFKIMRRLSGYQFDASLGTFSIISRKVVNSYLEFRDKDRHYLFILYWLGFNTGYIEYEHVDRYCGKTSYSFKKLVQHAVSGLLFQTTTLLHWIIYLGFAVSSLGLGSALYFICRYFFYDVSPGWTSLAVLILLIGGVIISSLGIIGLYIGGIFEQVKNRPLFIIDEVAEKIDEIAFNQSKVS